MLKTFTILIFVISIFFVSCGGGGGSTDSSGGGSGLEAVLVQEAVHQPLIVQLDQFQKK